MLPSEKAKMERLFRTTVTVSLLFCFQISPWPAGDSNMLYFNMLYYILKILSTESKVAQFGCTVLERFYKKQPLAPWKTLSSTFIRIIISHTQFHSLWYNVLKKKETDIYHFSSPSVKVCSAGKHKHLTSSDVISKRWRCQKKISKAWKLCLCPARRMGYWEINWAWLFMQTVISACVMSQFYVTSLCVHCSTRIPETLDYLPGSEQNILLSVSACHKRKQKLTICILHYMSNLSLKLLHQLKGDWWTICSMQYGSIVVRES